MADKTYTVTVASGNLYGGGTGNVFYLDGVRNATGPGTIIWVPGATLRFEQSDGTNDNHPLIFSTNTSTSGIISANVTYYLDGASNQANYTNTTTFNAATTRYVEITPSSFTDFYYLCYVHGIGMGGIMDMVNNSWSSNAWGDNSWNSLNNTISVTGIGASFSLGNETAQVNADVVPTGIAMTASQGNESILIATTGDPAGIAMTANLGTADPGPDSEVTGIAMSASIGTLDAFNSEGWGRKQWNTFAWGITGSLITTGQAATANIGTLSAEGDANVTPTGIAMSGNVGTLPGVEISFEIQLTGFAATTNLGTADAGPDAMLTGIGATAALGTLDAFNQTGWGRQQWNVNAWGVEGQFANILVTGVTASFNVGTLAAAGDAEVIPTGIGFTATEGTVDPSPDATVTGIGFSASLGLGTVTAGADVDTVTGIAMTANLGTAVGDANTISSPTGIAITATLSEESVVGDATAQLTGIQLTMSINSANALIWNEVNTGSAPLDPPGWVEVPTRAA